MGDHAAPVCVRRTGAGPTRRVCFYRRTRVCFLRWTGKLSCEEDRGREREKRKRYSWFLLSVSMIRIPWRRVGGQTSETKGGGRVPLSVAPRSPTKPSYFESCPPPHAPNVLEARVRGNSRYVVSLPKSNTAHCGSSRPTSTSTPFHLQPK